MWLMLLNVWHVLSNCVNCPTINSRKLRNCVNSRSRPTPMPMPFHLSGRDSDSGSLTTPPVATRRIDCMTPPPSWPAHQVGYAPRRLPDGRKPLDGDSSAMAAPRPRRISSSMGIPSGHRYQDLSPCYGRPPPLSDNDPRFKHSYKPQQTGQTVRSPHVITQPAHGFTQPPVRNRVWTVPAPQNIQPESRWEAAERRVARIKQEYESGKGMLGAAAAATAAAASPEPRSLWTTTTKRQRKSGHRVTFADIDTVHYFDKDGDNGKKLSCLQVSGR